MSRRVNGGEGRPVQVVADDENRPLIVDGESVLRRLDHYRKWVGILSGEPQIDVWQVEIPSGICELHFRSYPETQDSTGAWFLARWED